MNISISGGEEENKVLLVVGQGKSIEEVLTVVPLVLPHHLLRDDLLIVI
jgi:hypothetical protein